VRNPRLQGRVRALQRIAGMLSSRPLLMLWGKRIATGSLGALVALLALVLVPAERERIGPVTVSVRAIPGTGGTDLLVPPLGEVRANTHSPPLSVSLSLVEVDVQGLGREVEAAVTGQGFEESVESGLRHLAEGIAIRALIAAAIAGLITAAVLPHRKWHYAWSAVVGAIAVVAALLGATAVTFRVEAFEQPRYTGALTRAPVVIDALNKRELTIADVESRFRNGASRLTELLTVLAEPSLDPRLDAVAILHVSDIHSNPIGLQITEQLAEQFEVDAIVDTGDLTNFGVELETEFAKLVRNMPAPYYYVSGNHDSVEVQAALQQLSNVTVVHGREVDIAAIEFFGWPDPTYSNWNLLPPTQAAEIRVATGAEVADAVRTANPDVLLVHDRRLAQEAIGHVPLIVSGHYHRQIVEEENGTRLLAVGSSGAAGLQTFTTEADVNYEAEVIYFRDKTAVAVDYVEFSGLGGDFEIKRTMLPPLEEATESPSPDDSPTD
jgi:predicted MPP superfamily phosphohydrolase